MIVEVAIVEDERHAAQLLAQKLDKYSLECSCKTQSDLPKDTTASPTDTSVQFNIVHFNSGVSLLTNYAPKYDVVFMDISMPDMDGLVVSRKLRELDNNVIIVFVTNMADCAVKGYEVKAFDFLVKPVVYEHLRQVINRMMPVVKSQKNDPKLTIYHETGFQQINIRDIRYIEIVDHTLFYHMGDRVLKSYGSLNELSEKLKLYGFTYCNRCYLVNMNFVVSVDKFVLEVGESKLQISRPKKKEFMQDLANYIGDTIT